MHARRAPVLTTVIALVSVALASLILLRPSTPEPAGASPGVAAGTRSTATIPGTSAAVPGSVAASASRSSRPDVTEQPSTATTSAPAASGRCVVGIPDRLVIPALGVDAAFETIGVDTSTPADSQGRRALGNPTDRTRAGWYAAGPRPGSGTGTVLVNGHTYHDGSAIFQESFASQIADGQRIDVVQRNGSVCSYQVQRVWREVDAKHDYPVIVASQGLYDFSGPERLFLATCGGEFNSDSQGYDRINLLIATPIDR